MTANSPWREGATLSAHQMLDAYDMSSKGGWRSSTA
jgi:hypothetical protein